MQCMVVTTDVLGLQRKYCSAVELLRLQKHQHETYMQGHNILQYNFNFME